MHVERNWLFATVIRERVVTDAALRWVLGSPWSHSSTVV